MKVIKPTIITPSLVVSSDAPPDICPEWVAGSVYSINLSPALDLASHAPLVIKPTFADANYGAWGSYSDSYEYAPGTKVTAYAASSGELRVKDRDTLEIGNSFAVTPGETIHVSFDVNSSGVTFGGAVGLVFSTVGVQFSWYGAGYTAGTAWSRISGSIVVPAGATHATPWIGLDSFPWIAPSRPYTSIDNIYISRGQEGSGSTNLVVKPTFADANLGGWQGNAGTANTSAVTNSRGGDGMLTTVRRDTHELGNEFAVYAGETLHIAYESSSISSAYGGAVGVRITDDSGTVIAWLGVPYPSGAAWSARSGTVTIPSGAATAIPWLQIDCNHGADYGPVSFRKLYICRYALGTFGPFVRRSRTRKVFERLTTGTGTTAPEDDPINWGPVGPINEWAMFDREISTKTYRSSSLTTVLKPGAVNSLSAFGLVGSELRVTVQNGLGGPIVYGNPGLTGPRMISLDGTLITDWYQYYYEPTLSLVGITLTDLPPYINAYITVTLVGSGRVSMGLLDVGNFYDLGASEYSPSLTITDYSKKTTDEFGLTSFTKRGFAKRLHTRAMFDNVQLAKVSGVLASLRATPCSWSLTDVPGYETLNLFGWFEDIDIDVAYHSQSYCTLNIQGLSE